MTGGSKTRRPGDVEQTSPPAPSSSARARKWILGGVLVVLAAVVVGLVPLVRAANNIESVPLDVEAARGQLTPAPTTPDPNRTSSPIGPLPTTDDLETYLVIGSDERPAVEGSRADVLMVVVIPAGEADPIMFSLPRDLWLADPCGGGKQSINRALDGCGGRANGFELTTIVVEDFIGMAVDHVIGVGFDGFQAVIDSVGGIRICVDNPVRDVGLALPAGCTNANGKQTLAWVRSRSTQELVDGEWRLMNGVDDGTRNQRQQQLLLQLLARAGGMDSPSDLYALAGGLADAVAIDENLSFLDGIDLVWDVRGDAVRQFTIPVQTIHTSDGSNVVVPFEAFATTWEREVGPLPQRSRAP